MINKVKYGELKDDLLRLYCKVNRSSIEDIYIKISQAYDHNLEQWLLSHKSIKNKLNYPKVYDALETLFFLKNEMGGSPHITKIFSKLKQTSDAEMLIIFNYLVNGEARELLEPFRGIIGAFEPYKETVGRDIDAKYINLIQNDLLYVQNAFKQGVKDKNNIYELSPKPPRKTLSQQRNEMFLNLFNRFSNELSSAAATAGFDEIANKFREGILGVPPPIGIGEYIELDKITDSQMRESKRMADYVFKYPSLKNANYLHDLVELQLLQQAGSITKEDAYKFKETYEKQKNVMDIFNEDPKNVTEQKGIDTGGVITGDVRLNPDYIYMVVMFFIFLQQKIGVPPSATLMI